MALTGTHSSGDTGHVADHNLLDQAVAARQPLDSDLTAIAALATTSYGRAFLALADAAAARLYTGLPTEIMNTVATSGAAQAIPDVTTATVSYITLTANCTFTFPTAAAGKSFTVVLKQDSTARTATWPGTVKWPGGLAPTLTATSAKEDAFTFLCYDGTNWAGFTAGQNF